MEYKRTLAAPLRFSGVGVHTGKPVTMMLMPSERGDLVFVRTDIDGEIRPVEADVESGRFTALSSGGVRVLTIEHLMAALSACGVDSLRIELDAEEPPILDGSALPYARAISDAGTSPVPVERKKLKIIRPFTIEDGEASFSVEPDEFFRISYDIHFDHPAVGRQRLELAVSEDTFLREIAPARTFGFFKDVDDLRRRGLALGGSLDNAVVFDETGVMNGPLRFPDECVRHKIADMIGDLFLLGCPVLGRFAAVRAGHALHLRMVRALRDDSSLAVFV
ncbi:MAG: UDP-3-O-acyl-N-acetylglucosamine deacetylase [Acidobacteriota bacterium]|nr:UDP-3-O-acyl-N-acetylglucosamine deacetylase [Acidobacteriota bacterium]